MTTTQHGTCILGIPVSITEFDRFCQIRSEMLNSGKSINEAERWAACSIGIAQQFDTVKAERDAYAALVAEGSRLNPVTLTVR